MPVNLELKVKLNSFTNVKKLLSRVNAEYIGILNQTDIYYKTNGRLLKLRLENGEQSLIKYLRDENGPDHFSNYKILTISSGEAAEFFGSLFTIEAVVKKRRLLYIYDSTRIHLDTVKGLGYFLELETLVLKGKADARSRYNKIIKLLNLDKYEPIKKSYRDLVMSEST